MIPLLAISVSLLRPEWLLVLGLVPVFAWLTLRGAGRRRAGDFAALAMRSLLLLAVSLALSSPQIELEAESRSVAYVLDVSESIPPHALDRAQEFIELSLPHRADDDDASMVVFGEQAAVEVPFTRISATQRIDSMVINPRRINSIVGKGETDIDAGLSMARAGFPPGGARRVVLFTDGNETRGEARETVRKLLADYVDVQIVPLRYEREREILVEKLVAPGTAPRGEPIPIRAVISSTHDDVPVRVRFLIDGQEVLARDETLEAGRNVYEVGQAFDGGGLKTVEVIVEPGPGVDGNPANNRGMSVTNVLGRPRVLVVTSEPESPLASTLASTLDAEVDVVGADGVPADAAQLVPYDGIIIENIAAFLLSEAQHGMLRYAVREMGVGLICVGGPDAYGPGGYAGTAIEEVLPVSSEIKQKRVLPSGALVVVLHTCEFPGGNAVGRDVTKLAIRALSAQDEIGVIQYGMGGDEWLIPLQRVGSKAKHLASLDGASPGDMPSFDSSLKLAWDDLTDSRAAVKHMLIISDGDASPPNAKLAQKIRDDKITISTILIDPHSGGAAAVMQKLAGDTGRFYNLKSSQVSQLPQIFIKEAVTVRRAAWREEPFRVGVRGLHSMVRGFSEDEFPTLYGYTVTSMKPKAELLLAGPEEDPVLATWRHGLGEVVAWTSDASPRWAQDWTQWGGYGRFWSQVVRSSLRALEQPGVRVSTEVSGGTGHVVLDVLDARGEFLDGLTMEASAIDPDGEAIEYKISQTGRGRYEGKFPATKVGTYLSSIRYKRPDAAPADGPALVMAGACVAYSAEHLAQRSNERFFASLESDGATILDLEELSAKAANDENAVRPEQLPWMGEAVSSADPVELWPWLAALAALLLVTDVAVRRIRIKWPTFAKKDDGTGKPKGPVAKGKAKAPVQGAYDVTAAQDPGDDDSGPAATGSTSGPKTSPDSGGESGLLGAKRRAKRQQKWEENQ